MRVVVDIDTCQSYAVCMGAAPEVFEVRDDGLLYLLDDSPPESFRERVEEAARLCPVNAIEVT